MCCSQRGEGTGGECSEPAPGAPAVLWPSATWSLPVWGKTAVMVSVTPASGKAVPGRAVLLEQYHVGPGTESLGDA